MSVDMLPVTKSRVGRRSKDPTEVIRIKADLARKLGLVCTRRKVSTADILDPLIREFIEDEYRKEAHEIANELKDGNGKHKRK